jgi:hypothetical protein
VQDVCTVGMSQRTSGPGAVHHADNVACDAGMSAEHWLGYPLEHLVIPVLGEGDWTPAPAGWQEGVERGQF